MNIEWNYLLVWLVWRAVLSLEHGIEVRLGHPSAPAIARRRFAFSVVTR
jgi:hypothetical protein